MHAVTSIEVRPERLELPTKSPCSRAGPYYRTAAMIIVGYRQDFRVSSIARTVTTCISLPE